MTGAYVRISLGQRPYGPGRNGSPAGPSVGNARRRPRLRRRTRPAPWPDAGNPYLAAVTSIFLTASFFSTLRPMETVRMPSW